MNEDSRGLWRHYKEEKFYSKFYGRKHSKKMKKKAQTIAMLLGGPRVCKVCTCAHRVSFHARGACASGRKQLCVVFLLWVWGKTQFFSPNPLENQPINTNPLIHKFSFRTKRFKIKVSTRSFKGGVSLLNLTL